MPATFDLFLLHSHCVFKPYIFKTCVSDMHLGQCMNRRVNGKRIFPGSYLQQLEPGTPSVHMVTWSENERTLHKFQHSDRKLLCALRRRRNHSGCSQGGLWRMCGLKHKREIQAVGIRSKKRNAVSLSVGTQIKWYYLQGKNSVGRLLNARVPNKKATPPISTAEFWTASCIQQSHSRQPSPLQRAHSKGTFFRHIGGCIAALDM